MNLPRPAKPRSNDKVRPISAPLVLTGSFQPSERISTLETLTEYPFLKAALEDLEQIHRCALLETPNSRHVVCLMFDSLEFVLYEILLLHEKDIYKTGQNTIGFDDAIGACRDLGVDIPRIGTVRKIQKYRGDAKHHAQTPNEGDYRQLLWNFKIIFSRLVHEQFEDGLGETLVAFPLLSHRIALFESYRLRRNHDWEQAYRFALGALLRKHHEMFGGQGRPPFNFKVGHAYQLSVLEKEVAKASYGVAPLTAISALISLGPQVRKVLANGDWKDATSLVGAAYAETDKLLPACFDIDRAKRLTPKLYQPASIRHEEAMGWLQILKQHGPEEEEATKAIAEFMKANSKIVDWFGSPYTETSEDYIHSWWEFALFDDEIWHTFHLDTMFRISVLCSSGVNNEETAYIELLKNILAEFSTCNA